MLCTFVDSLIQDQTKALHHNLILPKNFLDWTKFICKPQLNFAKTIISVLDWVENMGKGENAAYQHFLLFPQCFQKVSFSGS